MLEHIHRHAATHLEALHLYNWTNSAVPDMSERCAARVRDKSVECMQG